MSNKQTTVSILAHILRRNKLGRQCCFCELREGKTVSPHKKLDVLI